MHKIDYNILNQIKATVTHNSTKQLEVKLTVYGYPQTVTVTLNRREHFAHTNTLRTINSEDYPNKQYIWIRRRIHFTS